MNFGYAGLAKPIESVWVDGRSVTVYPDGKVVSNQDGRVLREADSDVSAPLYDNRGAMNFSPAMVMLCIIALVVIVAIVAIVIATRR
jgi:hypothetical protein